ncbi:MAG: hypothetical protein PHZ04_02205 [Patescibacteria group bacterium]|nr:hypothetical protein [Patescibacteria group bacterium]MDD5294306.1 hypothetical protein [Patescibacteria group bacterium]MDD5554129.1 hypothetical protein [Patescibacteria group bacterium]
MKTKDKYTRETLLAELKKGKRLVINSPDGLVIQMKKELTKSSGENPDEVEAADINGPFRMSIDEAVKIVNDQGLYDQQ